ncbi:MAG: hypothetical protein Q7S32_01125 [bacterium]|nr:hypothetical protein [bacterium]
MRFGYKANLPKGFVLGKPIAQEKYDEEEIQQVEAKKRLVITLKRDGYKVYVFIGKGGAVKLYSSGMNLIDERLDHIKRSFESLGLKPGTLFAGGCLMDIDGQDDFGMTTQVFKSNPEKAIKFQEENGWEGLVLYNEAFVNSFGTDGKEAERPKGCWKWKPIMEDDFIVREWIPNPDNPDRFKELVLLQRDPETEEEFECGKLGSFGEKVRTEFRNAKYPFVVQAAFDMRFPKSGKIRNARFMRVRNDKPIHGCIAPQSYPEQDFPKVVA